MKIIFAGTPVFAATALEALIEAGHDIVLVLTQPDRPAGRGMKTVANAVKSLAQQHELTVLQPLTLKTPELPAQLKTLNADVMVVAAYGMILPAAMLSVPCLGCLNIHASLLPRWRGAAPIQRAILAGDAETGITIMRMDAGLDTGAMLLKKTVAILPNDTAQSLHDKLCILGAQGIVDALILLEQGKLMPVTQNEKETCYAPKIKKTEAEIDWQQPAEQINRAVRAFNPNPGAYTYFHGDMLKIWQAQAIPGNSSNSGEIVTIGQSGIVVACGTGLLRIEIIQKPGGRKLSAADFLAGYVIRTGEYFSAMNNPGVLHD
ncbi:MAG: methionyl-tRNA formyltransferase [Pseudomonadota bacterium]